MKKIAITEPIMPGNIMFTYNLEEVRGYLEQCGYYTIATQAAYDHLIGNLETPEKTAKLIRRDERILVSAFSQIEDETNDKLVLIFIGNTSDARIYDRNRKPYDILDTQNDVVLKQNRFYDAVFHVYAPLTELERISDSAAKERYYSYADAIHQAWIEHPEYHQIIGDNMEACTDLLARRIEDFLTESN